MNKLNKRIFAIVLMLAILGLMLVPANIFAQEPPPEPTDWIQEGWYEEYCEWLTEQQASQQQYTNETGCGLGALIDFVDWARIKVEEKTYWESHSYLFVDSTGERRSATWNFVI